MATGWVGNTVTASSSQACTGTFDQVTVTQTEITGHATACIGPNRSVGCIVPAGTNAFIFHTDPVARSAAAIGVPAWSLTALGILAVALGAIGWRQRRTLSKHTTPDAMRDKSATG